MTLVFPTFLGLHALVVKMGIPNPTRGLWHPGDPPPASARSFITWSVHDIWSLEHLKRAGVPGHWYRLHFRQGRQRQLAGAQGLSVLQGVIVIRNGELSVCGKEGDGRVRWGVSSCEPPAALKSGCSAPSLARSVSAHDSNSLLLKHVPLERAHILLESTFQPFTAISLFSLHLFNCSPSCV